ncbi:MAG: LamG domain-containing protein [Candidatus Aenigmarchaeota archaeon]|nr:LamG domain-containing protein [Candidatus Aenigmarchaeota archaeon]
MRTGQMFVVSMLFLAGLVFVVYGLLLQYSAADQLSTERHRDQLILQSLEGLLGDAISPLLPCMAGTCLALDGQDDYLEMRNASLLGNSSFSVEAWIQPADIAGRMAIVSGSDASGQGFIAGLDGGRPAIWLGSRSAAGAATLAPGSWHHYALSYSMDRQNATRFTAYLDGQEAAVLYGSAMPAKLLAGAGSGMQSFRGRMDKVGIDVAAASAGSIRRHALRAGQAQHQWELDENAGSEARSQSGQAFALANFNQTDVSGWQARFSCNTILERLEEVDGFVQRADFKGYEVRLIYNGKPRPAIDCNGQPGKLLNLTVKISSPLSTLEKTLNY